jgi:hypothetical protein
VAGVVCNVCRDDNDEHILLLQVKTIYFLINKLTLLNSLLSLGSSQYANSKALQNISTYFLAFLRITLPEADSSGVSSSSVNLDSASSSC